jgi:hypothetical protein
MKLRYWIITGAGAVAFLTGIENAAAAPMGAATTMFKTIRDDVSILTEVAQRRNNTRVSGRHKSGSNNPSPNSGWYPHDSDELPFGSTLWWQQKELERGGGGSGR